MRKITKRAETLTRVVAECIEVDVALGGHLFLVAKVGATLFSKRKY
jgi:hypothetical protein